MAFGAGEQILYSLIVQGEWRRGSLPGALTDLDVFAAKLNEAGRAGNNLKVSFGMTDADGFLGPARKQIQQTNEISRVLLGTLRELAAAGRQNTDEYRGLAAAYQELTARSDTYTRTLERQEAQWVVSQQNHRSRMEQIEAQRLALSERTDTQILASQERRAARELAIRERDLESVRRTNAQELSAYERTAEREIALAQKVATSRSEIRQREVAQWAAQSAATSSRIAGPGTYSTGSLTELDKRILDQQMARQFPMAFGSGATQLPGFNPTGSRSGGDFGAQMRLLSLGLTDVDPRLATVAYRASYLQDVLTTGLSPAFIGTVSAVGLSAAAIAALHEGGKLDALAQGFDHVAESVGGSNRVMQEFKEASRGTLSQAEIQKFTTGPLARVPDLERWSHLMENVRIESKRLGLDFKEQWEQTVQAVLRREPELIDQLLVSWKGLEYGTMSYLELLDETLRQTDDNIVRMGGDVQSADEDIQALGKSLVDVKDNTLRDFASSALGNFLQALINRTNEGIVGAITLRRVLADVSTVDHVPGGAQYQPLPFTKRLVEIYGGAQAGFILGGPWGAAAGGTTGALLEPLTQAWLGDQALQAEADVQGMLPYGQYTRSATMPDDPATRGKKNTANAPDYLTDLSGRLINPRTGEYVGVDPKTGRMRERRPGQSPISSGSFTVSDAQAMGLDVQFVNQTDLDRIRRRYTTEHNFNDGSGGSGGRTKHIPSPAEQRLRLLTPSTDGTLKYKDFQADQLLPPDTSGVVKDLSGNFAGWLVNNANGAPLGADIFRDTMGGVFSKSTGGPVGYLSKQGFIPFGEQVPAGTSERRARKMRSRGGLFDLGEDTRSDDEQLLDRLFRGSRSVADVLYDPSLPEIDRAALRRMLTPEQLAQASDQATGGTSGYNYGDLEDPYGIHAAAKSGLGQFITPDGFTRSARIQQLQRKADRVGLTADEKKELKRLDRLTSRQDQYASGLADLAMQGGEFLVTGDKAGIGTSLGALAGTAIGTAGGTLGAMFGSALPVVGTIAGGLIGMQLEKLLNKPKQPPKPSDRYHAILEDINPSAYYKMSAAFTASQLSAATATAGATGASLRAR